MSSTGGTERMVHSLSGLLTDSKRVVFQATFDAPGTPRHFDSAVPCYQLGPIPRLPLPLRPIAYALAAWRLHRLKKHLGVEITISNLWGADLISILSRLRDRKIALCHINVVGNPTNRLLLRLRPLVAAVYRRFDRVIAVSAPLAGEIASLYRLPAERIDHIDNFADRPIAMSCLPIDGIQRFVWCGRLVAEKNVEGLLHIWARFAHEHASVQLIMLGDGPLRQDLWELAARLGLQRATDINATDAQLVFVGAVSNPASYMLGARALLLTSHAEGLPLVVLESMSLGLPILASDCHAGGVRTAVQGHGQCNPHRMHAEMAIAGALLPVPHPSLPESLAPWEACLESVTVDEAQWTAWHEGGLERSKLFGRHAARETWLGILESVAA